MTRSTLAAIGRTRLHTAALAAALGASAPGAQAACLSPPGDLTGDGAETVVDVQCHIVSVLNYLAGASKPTCLVGGYSNADQDCSGEPAVTDVLLTIKHSLGDPLDPAIDGNADGCVDACQGACDGLQDGAVCSTDFDLCTIQACVGGACVLTADNPCDDGNDCTIDTCTGNGSCDWEPVAIFVDASNTSGFDGGTSWFAAKTSIQDAVAIADGSKPIWIAGGTYVGAPGETAALALNPFTAVAGLTFIGGFTGTECHPDARPAVRPRTAIVADTNLNGVDDPTDASVALFVNARSGYTFEDLTFAGTLGPAPPPAQGFLRPAFVSKGGAAAAADITFERCTFARGVGNNPGFLYNPLVHFFGTSGLTLSECTFVGNAIRGNPGAAPVAVTDSTDVTVERCGFFDNATFPGDIIDDAPGGALRIEGCAGVVVENSTFGRNEATAGSFAEAWGGALAVTGSTNVRVRNTAFFDNLATGAGCSPTKRCVGGAIAVFDGAVEVTGCAFTANEAHRSSAIYVEGGSVALRSSASFGHKTHDPTSGPLVPGPAGSMAIDHSCLETAVAGGGNVLLTSTPFVEVGEQRFLKHAGAGGTSTTPCVDAGDPTSLSDANIKWFALTTRIDGVLDGAPPDAGVHYRSCAGAADGTACSDDDPCTVADACVAGACVGTPMDCASLDPSGTAICVSGSCEAP